MGFFSDDPKGIKGSSGFHKLDRDIRETMHSSGIFGGPNQAKFVDGVFKTFAQNKDTYHGREIRWGSGVIEPHEIDEALNIVKQGADQYHIKPDQIEKLREHLQKDITD